MLESGRTMYKAMIVFVLFLSPTRGQTGLEPQCQMATPSGAILEGACVLLDQMVITWLAVRYRDGSLRRIRTPAQRSLM